MASANDEAFRVLPKRSLQTFLSQCLRKVRARLCREIEPATVGRDGCHRIERNRQYVSQSSTYRESTSLIEFSADPATHLQFLTSLLSRVNTDDAPEAHVLLLSSLAYAKLVYGDLEGTLADKDKAGKILDDLDGVDPSVNAAYYSIAADYHKVCVQSSR